MAEIFQVHVQRYDPDREPAAYVQSYGVEFRPSMTLLEVLEEIQGTQDSSLAFRSSCRIGKCGSCAVALDGKPALACRTVVDGRDIRVGPVPNSPVVKDLIVERKRFEGQQARTAERAQVAEPAQVAFADLAETEVDYANLSRCIECLVCDAACPVLAVQGGDAFPGPAWLPTALGSGVGIEENAAEEAFHCLLCGACAAACPSRVTADRLLELAREEVAERGLLPGPLAALDERVVEAHNISGEGNENRLMWADNLPASPMGVGKQRTDVVYFVGCVSSMFPRTYSVAQSFVGILERAGIDYGLLGEEEWCCGYPVAVNGELDLTVEMMRHNLQAVRARTPKRLVTTCPSCFYVWKVVYPEILDEDLGFEVQHATEFLAELLEAGQLPLRDDLPEQVVTYHDPCDLGRKSSIYAAPRRILAQLPGVKLVEMKNRREDAQCCGGGGNMESFDPDVSDAVAAQRIREAARTGARVVVSACQQCERTLSGAARAQKIRVRVKDITEMVLEAIE